MLKEYVENIHIDNKFRNNFGLLERDEELMVARGNFRWALLSQF